MVNIAKHINHYAWQESLAKLCIYLVACSVAMMFLWIIIDLIRYGLPHLSLSFLLDVPEDVGRAGGIGPIIVATLLIIAICMLISLPIGLGMAIFLAEYMDQQHCFGRYVRRSLDVLAAVPSIVFGLFGSAFFCIYLKMGFSIQAGGLTLACMVLPIFILSVEQTFRSINQHYRYAAMALGFSHTAMLIKILLPLAMHGVVAGFILGIGRAMAETAALIFTSGYVARMPQSISDSGRAMSVHIYDLVMNVPGADHYAYTTALVLVVILLLLNSLATWLANYLLKDTL